MEVKILIDTNAYSLYRKEHSPIVRKIADSESILVSPVVLGEILFGFRKGSRFEYNMSLLTRFLEHEAVEVVPIAEVTSDRYARIMLQLRRQGTPIPSNDMWIAAQAMEHGAELLTSDRHFEQISGLVCTVY
ncbi:MAG: type II toxin-antitoxin system VapC family toxin [Candidatus Deferrimicrobiota bacterium]